MKVYVAGPMTGLPDSNLPAFEAAAAELTEAGFDVVNPGRRGVRPDFTWEHYMREALRDLLDCDGVAVLNGWAGSRGVALETHVAGQLGMPVLTLATWLGQVAAIAPIGARRG